MRLAEIFWLTDEMLAKAQSQNGALTGNQPGLSTGNVQTRKTVLTLPSPKA
jgi:hypothetical protein